MPLAILSCFKSGQCQSVDQIATFVVAFHVLMKSANQCDGILSRVKPALQLPTIQAFSGKLQALSLDWVVRAVDYGELFQHQRWLIEKWQSVSGGQLGRITRISFETAFDTALDSYSSFEKGLDHRQRRTEAGQNQPKLVANTYNCKVK